jgi:predicted lipoprotein
VTIRKFLLCLAIPAFLANAAVAEEQPTKVIEQAINSFIRPSYAELHDKASGLTARMNELCAAPSSERLDAARQGFTEAAGAFSRVEIIRFGPITENNRMERLLFWPDRKGTGLKQVQKILAEKDASAANVDDLFNKSVASQGFGALEYVLFGTDSDGLSNKDDAFRCTYGAAIAGNIERIGGDVSAGWNRKDGFAAQWSTPGPDNAIYRDDREAITELLEVFVNGLELVRDVRVGGFLGAEPDADKPKQALYWRSRQTTASFANNITGMKALFDRSGFGRLVSPDSQWLVQSIRFEFNNAIQTARAANGPIEDILKDEQARSKLAYFQIVTSSLSDLFGTRIAGELGLTAGFSSLDGD